MCNTRYELIIDCIDETINKSSINNFKNFIEANKKYMGWVIVSDYCIDDDKKYNDCLSFSIIPMEHNLFFTISEEIKNNITNDLKHTTKITQDTVNFLHDNPYTFCFNFIIKGINNLIGNFSITEKQNLLRDEMNKLIANINVENDSFTKYKNIYHRHFLKKTFPANLFAKNAFVAFLAAYLRVLILKYDEKTVKPITWLPDRGKFMSSFDNIYASLHQLYYELLIEKENITWGEKSVTCGLIKDDDTIFYDELIRIPDYMAGTLSSYEYETNNTDKDKHAKLIEETFANNDKIINLVVDLTNDIQCGRLVINKTDNIE